MAEESVQKILDLWRSRVSQFQGKDGVIPNEETTHVRITQKEPLHRAIKKEWTFETFVTGATNERACLAARRLAEWNATEWSNPFVVVGDTGAGKSHLMHAVANYAWTLKPSSHIIYIDARDYAHEYRNAMFGDMPAKQAYEKKYAGTGMILFESIHLFKGPGSQSQFAFVLDQAEQRKAIVMISSLEPISSLKSLSEELKSRLQKVDSARIEKPDLDLMVRIALSKAERFGLSLSLTDAHMLANEALFDIRTLEGFLHTIKSTVELRGCDVKAAIDEWIRCQKTDSYDAKAFIPVAMAVSRNFGVSMEAIMNGDRKAFNARSAIMLICRLRGLSDHRIAWFFSKIPEEVSRAFKQKWRRMINCKNKSNNSPRIFPLPPMPITPSVSDLYAGLFYYMSNT